MRIAECGPCGRVGHSENMLHGPALNEPVKPCQHETGPCGSCGPCNREEILTYLKKFSLPLQSSISEAFLFKLVLVFRGTEGYDTENYRPFSLR